MIVEKIVGVLAGMMTFVADLFPEMEQPGWVGSIANSVGEVTNLMAPLGSWVPFTAAGQATYLVVGAVAVALVIRLVRIVLSLTTGGGGGSA